jgi:hypothetical protein
MPEKEQEISIGADLQEAPQAKTEAGKPENQQHMFDAGVGKLDLAGKESPEDILDAIINAKEDDLIPWEEITLPSGGVYYQDKIPGGVVRVRPMGTHAEKIMATQRLAQSGQSLDYLYKHCVQLPNGFDPIDLLAGDRVFLLYVLRGITHGNMYEFLMECPHCEVMSTYRYDLNELASTITRPDPSIGSEPFKVVLPYLSEISKSEVFVNVRFMRGRDLSIIAQRQRFKKKVSATAQNAGGMKRRTEALDEAVTENLNLLITDFMGKVRDPNKIKLMVEKLHSADSSTIREFVRKYSPGISPQIEVGCPECNANFKTELPITETFFRPSERRRV